MYARSPVLYTFIEHLIKFTRSHDYDFFFGNVYRNIIRLYWPRTYLEIIY